MFKINVDDNDDAIFHLIYAFSGVSMKLFVFFQFNNIQYQSIVMELKYNNFIV